MFVHYDHFLSFTRHQDETSLIVDEECLGLFPANSFISTQTGRVISIYHGRGSNDSVGAYLAVCFVDTVSGLIRHYTRPLAHKEVTVLDITTHDRDLLVVSEDQANQAFTLLCESNCANTFQVKTWSLLV